MWKEQDVLHEGHGTVRRPAGLTMQEVEESNLFKDDGTVIHFDNEVQASIEASTYVVSGTNTKKLPTCSPRRSRPGWQRRCRTRFATSATETCSLTSPKR